MQIVHCGVAYAQRGFTSTMRCALIPWTPTIDSVAAHKSATGGCEPPWYEFLVRGPIGPAVMQAFPTLRASRSGHDTLLTGLIPDQSALYGLIHELEVLGLQLLEINRRKCGGAWTTGQIT